VFDAACPWAWVLSQVLSIPCICSMTALPVAMSERENTSASEWSSCRTLDATVSAVKAAYGVSLNHNYSYANYAPFTIIWTSRAWHKGHDEFPPDEFQYWGPPPGRPRSGIELNANLHLQDLISGLGRKRLVYISLGTVATGYLFPTFAQSLEDFYRKACKIAADMPSVAFAVSLGKSLPAKVADDGRVLTIFDDINIPPNMVACAFVDQQAVLEKAHVFVTHCGQNSCSEAIGHGVPVVAVPFFGDQIVNGERFQELGCGILLRYTEGRHARLQWQPDHDRIPEGKLAGAIKQVLEEPQFRKSICALRHREQNETGQQLSHRIVDMLKFVDTSSAQQMFS